MSFRERRIHPAVMLTFAYTSVGEVGSRGFRACGEAGFQNKKGCAVAHPRVASQRLTVELRSLHRPLHFHLAHGAVPLKCPVHGVVVDESYRSLFRHRAALGIASLARKAERAPVRIGSHRAMAVPAPITDKPVPVGLALRIPASDSAESLALALAAFVPTIHLQKLSVQGPLVALGTAEVGLRRLGAGWHHLHHLLGGGLHEIGRARPVSDE